MTWVKRVGHNARVASVNREMRVVRGMVMIATNGRLNRARCHAV